jgi:hypothetical protein
MSEPEMRTSARNGSRLGGAALTGAGIGIGTVLGAVLQDQPEVIAAMVNWGPGLIIVLGAGWFAQRFLPPVIAAQQQMATNVGELAGAIKANLSRDDDVRDAVRSLAAKMDRHHEVVLNHIQRSKETAAS